MDPSPSEATAPRTAVGRHEAEERLTCSGEWLQAIAEAHDLTDGPDAPDNEGVTGGH